jgi:hypothetical protein
MITAPETSSRNDLWKAASAFATTSSSTKRIFMDTTWTKYNAFHEHLYSSANRFNSSSVTLPVPSPNAVILVPRKFTRGTIFSPCGWEREARRASFHLSAQQVSSGCTESGKGRYGEGYGDVP